MGAKILIDAISMSHPQPGGYKTYVTNLVRSLRDFDDHNSYVLALDRPISWTPSTRWQQHILERRNSLGVIWREQYAIPRLAIHEDVDLVHAPSAKGALWRARPMLVTLYDTIEFTEALPSPTQAKRWSMRLYNRFSQKLAARRASHVVTISDYSKRQIALFFSIPQERITAIHLAPSPIFSVVDPKRVREKVKQRWSIANYVLGIASAAKRKNMDSVFAAYALLPGKVRREHPLVLVCTHPGVKAHMNRLAEKSGLTEPIVLLENVNDIDLAHLYSAGSVFVFPSLDEGFGLPPLEAMACGTPVIASNSSSLPEVIGDAGLLVDPVDTAQIAHAIDQVLTDQTLAEDLRSRGIARSKGFSWEKVAKETVAIYEMIAQQ